MSTLSVSSAISQKATREVLERLCEVPQLGGLWNSPPRAWVRYERKECNYSLIRNPDFLLQNVVSFSATEVKQTFQTLKHKLASKEMA